MGERSSQVERDIEQQRSELNDNMLSLREKTAPVTGWRGQFKERPLVLMGLAFGGGALLSAVLDARPRTVSATARGDRSIPDGFFSERGRAAHGQLAAMCTDAWDALKTTVTTLAAARLGSTMEALLPGFEAEYQKAAQARTVDADRATR